MWSIQIAQSRIKLQRSILAKLTGTCACIMPAAARALRVVSAVASTAPEKLLGRCFLSRPRLVAVRLIEALKF